MYFQITLSYRPTTWYNITVSVLPKTAMHVTGYLIFLWIHTMHVFYDGHFVATIHQLKVGGLLPQHQLLIMPGSFRTWFYSKTASSQLKKDYATQVFREFDANLYVHELIMPSDRTRRTKTLETPGASLTVAKF